VALALYNAARSAQHTLADALAGAAAPPTPYAAYDKVGSLVVANVLRGSAMRFTTSAVSSHALPSVRTMRTAAMASEAFIIVLEGGDSSSVREIVLSTTPSALRRAFHRVYGTEAERLWLALLRAPPDRLLPVTRAAMDLASTVVQREAASAAARGEASQRSPASITARANAILLLDELKQQLRSGSAAFVWCRACAPLATQALHVYALVCVWVVVLGVGGGGCCSSPLNGDFDRWPSSSAHPTSDSLPPPPCTC
jgi:hypothetical protein